MKSIEALWAIYFGDTAGQINGGGVFETGRIFGGDSRFYYVGDFSLTGNDMEARVKVTNYHGDTWTAFGFHATEPFDVKIKGTIHRFPDRTVIKKTAWIDKFPDKEIPLGLRWLECLP